MEVVAKHINARISAQKVRLIADLIRGKHVEQASEQLQFSNKKAAAIMRKVLSSAIANAEHNNGAEIDDLYIAKVYVDDAPTLKRFHARARGRGDRILKRGCHITVVVSDSQGA